jgi:MFS transporter, DHA1 family, tetracycline resistance protein
MRLRLLYAIILIDVIAWAAIGPVMPVFVAGLAQPQAWLALGTALFLGMQLVSAPLLGELSDRVGRRPVFIVSAIGTVLAAALLLPVRRTWFFVNRVSDGLTNGMYAAVRSAITDLSAPGELYRNLGIEGAIISLGFVIGPLVSGLMLTVFDVAPPAQTRAVVLLTVGLALLNVGLCWVLPESHPNPTGLAPGALRATIRRALNPLDLWQRLRRFDDASGRLRRIVIAQLALTLCLGNYPYFVPYLSAGPQRMSARDISLFFMYFGALSIIINYVFYTYLAERLNPRRALVVLALLGVPVLMAYGLTGTSRPAMYVVATIDCFTISLISGLLEGLLARCTTDENRGEIFGLNQAVQGLASFGTTLVFGALSLVDLRLPWAWFALCLATVAGLAWQLPAGTGASSPPDSAGTGLPSATAAD